MFQYAAALRLALRHRTQVLIDASWYDNIPAGATPRAFELGQFQISGAMATANDRVGTDGVRKEPLKRLPLALWRKLSPKFRFVAERQFHFDERVLDLPDGVCLYGYWVSEKYFLDAADAVRREFSFREPARGESAVAADRIATTQSVSVHVRRGDYAANPELTRIHGTCPPSYYAAAVAAVFDRVPNAQFFVFSDDLDWAEAKLKLPAGSVFVRHNAACPGEDLRLMSLCRHHVIANSGFSWWGAWLNPRPTKVVVAPRHWFADERYDTRDILPAGWLAL